MAELNLKTEWIAEDVVKISWNDAWHIGQSETAGGAALIGVLAIFGVGVFFALNGAMLVLLLSVILCFGLAIFLSTHSFTFVNSLAVDLDGLHQDECFFPLDDISRIEYSPKSQWTGNQPQAGKKDPTQIRLWLHDHASFVLSENNWETQVNHRIRHAIEAAINDIRKMDNEDRRFEEHGTENQYGIPDY